MYNSNMNENKTSAKNLTAGTWVEWDGLTYVVQYVTDYGNGWVRVDLSDGRSVDCLAYRAFATF